MKSMKEKLEAAAASWASWVEQGRGSKGLLDNRTFLAAQCWLYSPGAKHDGYSQEVADFVAATRAAIGGDMGWSKLLRQRDYCDRCGERYRVENLAICCTCHTLYCYRCGSRSRHPNGNQRCSCGGEIVG